MSCNKITHLVILSKTLAGILATETVLTRRNQGTETNGKGTAVCKLCGIADETNLHMLCECTGNRELVTERRSWIRKMRKVVKDTLSKHMNPALLDVLMSLWNVDELGKINTWVSDDRRNLEAPGIDPILLQLRVLIDKQKGVENHMYGITTTAWRDFLEDALGIPPSIALKFQVDLHRCTQHAIGNMWKERNFARHGMTSPSEIWELRVFEAAIRSWKNEAKRKGGDLLEGAEERIRALPRKQKLAWVHNRLRGQKGIKEFWSSAPARSDVDAELGRELELVADIEPGNVGQIPPDLPNKGQIRGVREKERKQSHITQFFSGGKSSEVTTKQASEATTAPATGLGPSSSQNKKRIASGDLRQKASKTQIVTSKNRHGSASKRSNQLDLLTLKDQAQREAENQAGDRPRATTAPSQLPEEVRRRIARKRDEAIRKKKEREEGKEEDRFILEDQAQIEEENQAAETQIARNKEDTMILAIKTKQDKAEGIKKKNDRAEGEQVEHRFHKKQKSKQSEKLKKRYIEDVEEEEVAHSSKRQKENGKKRDNTEVEDAEQQNSSKREKSAGKNGCKQLGCSTHKGIS